MHNTWGMLLLLAWRVCGGAGAGGADHRVADLDGKTAMDIAREKGHRQCVELLQVRRASAAPPGWPVGGHPV